MLLIWLVSIVPFRRLHRRQATHQAAIAAWRTTAGHNATPCSPKPMPAKARTAVASDVVHQHRGDQNPLAARLCVSSRASQQATPSASNAAPATRPSIPATDASNPEPTRSTTVAEGEHSRARPAPSSIAAVNGVQTFHGRRIVEQEVTEEAEKRCLCLPRKISGLSRISASPIRGLLLLNSVNSYRAASC